MSDTDQKLMKKSSAYMIETAHTKAGFETENAYLVPAESAAEAIFVVEKYIDQHQLRETVSAVQIAKFDIILP